MSILICEAVVDFCEAHSRSAYYRLIVKGKSILNRKVEESIITLLRNEFLHQGNIT